VNYGCLIGWRFYGLTYCDDTQSLESHIVACFISFYIRTPNDISVMTDASPLFNYECHIDRRTHSLTHKVWKMAQDVTSQEFPPQYFVTQGLPFVALLY
jgi:hypothetical protein